jgi:O-succinylbenzoic acid--CoA ligase
MTIILGNSTFDLKKFMYKDVKLTENFPSIKHASHFLSQWISGGKEFEIQTSGTTGAPKTIILKRKWLETSALQTIQILKLWDEKVYCCIPTQKIGGLMMIIRALAGGFSIKIIEPKLNPMLDLDELHDYTFISLVPSQLNEILKDKPSTQKLNRFKNVLLGGSSVSDFLQTNIKDLIPHVYHTYGMTETCSHIALKKLNHGNWLHFKPNPFVEIKSNENKCLCIKAFQTGNEWVETNDMVTIFEDGTFEFLGRNDFVINTGGFKVYPELLEAKILTILYNEKLHSPLAISWIKSETWGEEVVLVLTDICKEEPKLLELLKSSLKSYEMPRKIIKLEQLPYNESGKLDRNQLHKLVLSIA